MAQVELPNVGRQSVVQRGKKYLEEALYRRLFKGGGSEQNVRSELNRFLKSHKLVYKWEVGLSLKKLRQRKQYDAALKLSEAMSKRGMNLTLSDQAIRLDLVAKARGVDAAEKYFMELPEQAKNQLSYGALLNCYCKELMTEKAESLMEKMKELRFASTSMAYNSLMTLYTKTDHHEKIPELIKEMKATDVMPDCFTYNVWMRGLAAANEISGVERVIEEMKRDGRVTGDWTTYSNLASIYVNAGMFKKAEMALRELEKRNEKRDPGAFQFLITLYGRTGNLMEVYRVWRSLKLAVPKMANISYLNMIQVLVNLNDLPGAEKCFKEWESSCSVYDIRVANVLIGAYAKADSIDMAKELRRHARNRGAKPNAKTWEIFMEYYLQKGNAKGAVDCIANAVEIGRGDGRKWCPPPDVVLKVMMQFEQDKDVGGAEGFLVVLDKAECEKGEQVFECLIRTYAAAGKKDPLMKRRLRMENVEMSLAAKDALEEICAE